MRDHPFDRSAGVRTAAPGLGSQPGRRRSRGPNEQWQPSPKSWRSSKESPMTVSPSSTLSNQTRTCSSPVGGRR
eukprot:g17377.t1